MSSSYISESLINREQLRNIFKNLRDNSDKLLEEKTSNLSEKTKKYVEIYMFDYDIKSHSRKRFNCAPDIYEEIKKSIQNFFEERNLLIEKLTKNLGNL